jgi:hypothetical protein
MHWAVQLEWLELGEGWVWIARYDTSGGHPHRDRNRIAKHEPVQLARNPGRAIQEAKQELETHYWRYTEDYQAAKATGRQAW